MIDYITLMLVNMAAGFVLLAYFVCSGLDEPHYKKWIPGFGAVGAIALTTGLHMTLTWPIVGSYNIAFGEMAVLFGILFMATAISMTYGWRLDTLAIYAFFSGLGAVIVGVRIVNMGLTLYPWVAGAGFVLSGLSGICALPALRTKRKGFRRLGVAVLLGAALIWALLGYGSYWQHLSDFSDWKPATMQ